MRDIDKRSLRLRQQSPQDGQATERPAANARPSVQVACASEISKWCQREEDIAMDLLADNAAASDLQAALLSVNQCLASRTKDLSPICLSTLLASYMEAPRGTGAAFHERAGDRNRVRGGHGDGPRRPNTDSDDDNWPPSKGQNDPDNGHTTNADNAGKYYWDNHGFGSPDEGRQIRSGDHDRPHPHRHQDGHLEHSAIAWLVFLPFFAFGVFVAAKRALSFYRQRQLAMTHHSIDARDYEPINPRQTELRRRDEDE